MTQVHCFLSSGRWKPNLLQLLATTLLWTISFGDHGGEVKAFLDESGQLHWGGQTFFKQKLDDQRVNSAKPIARGFSCERGMSTQASYGSAEENVTLVQTISAGDVIFYSCRDTFARNEFTGHFLIRCVAAAVVEIEYQCGCAAGRLLRPRLDSDSGSPKPRCTRTLPPDEQTATFPEIVWSSGDLLDGAVEDRLCSELASGTLGAWRIRCLEGRLCAEIDSCDAPHELVARKHAMSRQAPALLTNSTPLVGSVIVSSVDVVDPLITKAEKDEELRWQRSVSRRINKTNASAAFAKRRLAAVDLCLDPPQDNWWPHICAITLATPYSTVAGARLAGEQMNQLDSPYGLFVSPINDDLYIADWKNHRIQRVPQARGVGQTLTVAGETGAFGTATDLHVLFNPADIVVSQNVGSGSCNEMFIADESNNRILRWPPYSNRGFILAGGPDGQLDHPTGIHVTADLDVYVADRLHHRVVMYSKHHLFLEWVFNKTIAGLPNNAPGSTLDALDRPTDVALNSLDEIFIADFGNDRIVMWKYAETVGVYIGRCYGAFSIFINEDNIVFAACQTSHCIKRWEPQGGSYIEGPVTGECAFFVQSPHIDTPWYQETVGRFFSPSGVYVDKYGNIYVSDTRNSRVMKRGRDPLTQWTVVNGASIGYKFTFQHMEFYPNLACDEALQIKTYISADGVRREPWNPSCSELGNGRCPINEAWIGRQFTSAVAIRCVVLIVNYTNSGGALFDAAVRYWDGSEFITVYTFGKIPSGQRVVLRYPRFDDVNPSCVKGQRYCVLNFTGDWQANGDRIMFTLESCTDSTTQGLLGFPKVGISDPATENGVRYLIGDPNVADHITVDASAGDKYTICWCDYRIKNCELGTDFTLFVDYLSVEGPFDVQSQYGWRGAPLHLNALEGVGLKPGDKLTVVSGKCGLAASDVIGIPRQPGANIAHSAPSVTGWRYTWTDKILNTDPDSYTLCWCRPIQTACTHLLDFQALSGTVSINGPMKQQQFNCIKGDPCNFVITGVNLEVNDGILVLARCAQGPLLNGFPWEGTPRTVTYSNSSGSTGGYGWGDNGIVPTVGMYYLCWCSRQRASCAEPESFGVEVGFLTVAGPEKKPYSCALGADCVILLSGVQLWRTYRAIVVPESNECGGTDGGPVPNFPGESEGVSYPAEPPGTTLIWGYVDQNLVSPSNYKACWCHTGSPCAKLEDYKVFLGEMMVIGPYSWLELKTCGVGKDCIVSLMGLGLSRKDTMVMIDGSCGTGGLAQVVGNSINVEEARSRTDTGIDHIWLADQVFVFGSFSVCWCSDNCLTPADYKMTVGMMDVSAPAIGQQKSCTSGAACSVRLQGFALRDTDRIAIMTPSCGSTGLAVPGVPNQGTSISTVAHSTYADFMLGVDDGGTNVVNANGGFYRICWCPSRCGSVRDYLFDAGQLTLWAPTPDHSYICYNGKTCTATGISGYGLQNGDQVRASSTCWIMLLVGGLPQQGVSLQAVDQGTTFTWGPQKLKAIVGKYRLCWCSFPHNCDDPQNYMVDIGSLIIGGPVAGQTYVCQAGYKCELNAIEGFGLQAGDLIVILYTCGTGDPIYRGWVEGMPWIPWPPFVSSQQYGCDRTTGKCKVDFRGVSTATSNFIFNADTGKYRMCWCDTKTGSCTTVDDFTVDIGLFTAVGPDADQTFFCVPGFTCTLHEIKGVSLGDGDRYVLQKSPECEGGNVVEGVPNGGISENATASGRQVTWISRLSDETLPAPDYTLCWCPFQVRARGGCKTAAEYVTRAAIISVVGPLPDHYYQCFLGSYCIIDGVLGNGLQNNDRLIVAAGDCGPNSALADKFPGQAMSAPAEVTGTKYTLDMLVNSPTGRYRLCWCPNSRTIDPPFPIPFGCLDSGGHPITSNFTVDLGELHLPEVPATGQVRYCISGTHCVIGSFVGSTNQPLPEGSSVLVKMNRSIANDQICVENSESVEGFPDFGESWPSTNHGTQFAWGNGTENRQIWAVGGRYILCWKPEESEYFAYLLGFLWVLGPGNTSQSFTCTKSATCAISNIQGVGMSDGDYFRVMSPCADDYDEPTAAEAVTIGVPVVQMESGVVTWKPEDFQGAPKHYKVCWCHKDSDCTKPVDFRSTVGTMIISGPVAGQNRKCDRGQKCLVSEIVGINLQEGDEVSVLVECGVGPDVSGLYPRIAVAKKELGADQYSFEWAYTISTPGIYRTCWCQASECAVPGASKPLIAFDVEMGILTIQGPDNAVYLRNPVAPLWSHQWDIELQGVNLHTTPFARLRIMKLCPSWLETESQVGEEVDSTVRIGYPVATKAPGKFYYFRDKEMTSIIPATYSVEDEVWQSNRYVLCWCRGGGCLDISSYALTIGPINVLCEKGSEPTAVGCRLCPVGTYKEIDANEPCRRCSDNDLWTTESAGTRLQAECFCKPGYYYSIDTLKCTPCDISHYCIGGNRSHNGELQRCPDHSGAWPRSNSDAVLYGFTPTPETICSQCTGYFPARSALDCSCVQGAETQGQVCYPCPINYFKFFKGNISKCVLCGDEYSRSSTFGAVGQSSCTCDPGLYMVIDEATGLPRLCADCPVGYWCYNGTRTKCPRGRFTRDKSSTSFSDCLCGAGYFANKLKNNLCEMCPGGALHYKDQIGDFKCDKECPANSVTVLGARGPENCLCIRGYKQTLNMTSLSYRCEEDLEGDAEKPQTRIRLTAVFTEALFIFTPPADGSLTLYPSESYLASNRLVPQMVAAELGLSDDSQITVIPEMALVSPKPNLTTNEAHMLAAEADTMERRLSTEDNNSSNTTYTLPYRYANGSVVVRMEVIIWQSSVRETKELQEELLVMNTDRTVDSLLSQDPLFANLVELTFREDQTRVGFHWEECPPNSAVPAGATFVSADFSCKCAPGFQPRSSDPDNPDECEQYASDDAGKCIPCCTKKGNGRYKDQTGDMTCRACNMIFPATDPQFGATSSLDCICQPGYYRPGITEDCIICPVGHWCTGGTVIVDCPPNEWTVEPGNDNESDCECDLGYFKPYPHDEDLPCIGCDAGYYKTTVENGIGRCSSRCTTHFGRRSTSAPAAKSMDECVCSEHSYMQRDATQDSGFQCAACPLEGVTCTGWKRNVTNESGGWTMEHARPEANLGYFMLDERYAKVEECRTQTLDQGSVCRGKGRCSDGHEGLLCGNCQAGWTRNKYPDPCRTCNSMPPSGLMVLQLLGDTTLQALWAQFLAVSALQKTETQKNVLTVLLRMFTHWQTQVGVLTANFNLTKLHPLSTSNEEEEVIDDDEVTPVNEAPPNETDPGGQEGFAFPGFFSDISEKLTLIAEVLAGVGSTQEVIECMIDRRFQGDGSIELTEAQHKSLLRWKLIGPAIWWFLYPGLVVTWLVLMAAFISYAIVPIVSWCTKPRVNPKKARKKLKRRQQKLRAKKLKARQQARENAEKKEAEHTVPKSADLMDGPAPIVEIRMTREELENFSDDSSSASSSSSDGEEEGSIEVFLHHTPEFLSLCDEMVGSVANPPRFSFEYVQKEMGDEEEEEGTQSKRVEYYLMLFRTKPVYSREFFVDIAPWIIIMLNNVWNVVTQRMLQLVYCESFYWIGTSTPDPTAQIKPGLFLMMRPDVACYTFQSVHGMLCIIAMAGMSTWSFGIILVYYHMINSRDKQSRFVTRNFGYLLEGYEPQFWYWELTVKKIDLLVTALITYTSIAKDPRAKILLFSVQSAIAFAVQLSTGPYDNRQLRLLDGMENLGLLVRQLIFTGIAFSLLFGGGKIMVMVLAFVLCVMCIYFIMSLVIHAADDWVSTQVAITKEKFVLGHIDAQRKALKKMRKAGIPIDPDHLPEVSAANFVAETKLHIFGTVQHLLFAGGSAENGYRHVQLLRCMWNGPGTDALLYIPETYEGYPHGKVWWRTMGLYAVKWFNGLITSHQQDAFAEHMGCFVALLLSLANFNQFPARFTDMVFFLARAVKRLKSDMENYPNTVRPANPDEEESKPQTFRDRDWLKVGMLEELYSSMIDEGTDKRLLLERNRKGVRDVLKRENVPLEAAWDVLDRLTNDQLRRAVLSPVAMFARVGFFLTLSASTERCTQTVADKIREHKDEKKARKKIYRYVQFALRSQLEENADVDLDWTYVRHVLEALPVAELKRLIKTPNEIIDVSKAHRYLLNDEPDESVKTSTNVMTVEDLNSMLMFLQKLPFDQLHHIIEYTQMLLDFLSLPAKANWRDEIINRGRRMGKAPDYYRRSRQQRLKMREHVITGFEKEKHDRENGSAAGDADDVGNLGDVIPQAPSLSGLHLSDAKAAKESKEVLAPFGEAPEPGTKEAKLHKFLTTGLAEDAANKLEAGRVLGGLLLQMDDFKEDDNMSVSSLGSLDDAIQWTGAEQHSKDPLWKKIDNLRKKTGTDVLQAVADRELTKEYTLRSSQDDHTGSRGEVGKHALSDEGLPSTISGASKPSSSGSTVTVSGSRLEESIRQYKARLGTESQI